MGLFGNDDGIVGAALGASGAFDNDKKTDKAAAFGAAIGASIGSGKKWTFEDSLKLGAAINTLDSVKDGVSGNYTSGVSYSNHLYDNLFLNIHQEEQLEEAGIDLLDFDLMDDDEKMDALEEAGLDPYDFDMY